MDREDLKRPHQVSVILEFHETANMVWLCDQAGQDTDVCAYPTAIGTHPS